MFPYILAEFGVISTQQVWFKQTIALQLSCDCVKLSRTLGEHTHTHTPIAHICEALPDVL